MPATQSSKLTPDSFMAQQMTPDSFMASRQPDPNNPAASIPNPTNPKSPANPINQWDTDPSNPNAPMPGVSEGAGLREGLGEWVDRSAGDVLRGGADIAKGSVAKGMHQVLSGGMNATAPALPFAAAAAPLAVARGLVGGAAGGTVAHAGAEAFGASPDQADVAGDVGGIVGGGLASNSRVARVGRKLAKGTFEDIPGVRQAGKIPQYWKETAPPETPRGEIIPPDVYSSGYRAPRAHYAGPPPEPIPARSGLALTGEVAESPSPGPAMHGPETPAKALLQARPLSEGGAQQTVDPSAGLGEIPVRGSLAQQMKKLPAGFEPAGPQYQPPTGSADNPATGGIPRGSVAEAMKQPPITRGSLKQMMESLNGPLDQSVGAKGLEPNVPLKNQVPARGGVAEMMKSAGLSEGHTAVDSSALKSYKYDAGTNEFHARYRSGSQDHVFGDVSPAEAQAFEAAPSKGKAMAAIQQNHPLVAKIVDGKRIAIKSGARARP